MALTKLLLLTASHRLGSSKWTVERSVWNSVTPPVHCTYAEPQATGIYVSGTVMEWFRVFQPFSLKYSVLFIENSEQKCVSYIKNKQIIWS